MSALLQAICDDDSARVQQLLAADASLGAAQASEDRFYENAINHWLYRGDTALHLAAAGHRVDCVVALLEIGSDPNAAHNRRRGTPLHYAADGLVDNPEWHPERQVATLERLVHAGADCGAQDANGATALHRAVRTRCADAVVCLLAAGADPSATNRSGATPFHLAVQNTGRGGTAAAPAQAAQQAIIETFLAHGVSPALVNGAGKSVAACARSRWIRDLLTGS